MPKNKGAVGLQRGRRGDALSSLRKSVRAILVPFFLGAAASGVSRGSRWSRAWRRLLTHAGRGGAACGYGGSGWRRVLACWLLVDAGACLRLRRTKSRPLGGFTRVGPSQPGRPLDASGSPRPPSVVFNHHASPSLFLSHPVRQARGRIVSQPPKGSLPALPDRTRPLDDPSLADVRPRFSLLRRTRLSSLSSPPAPRRP